MRMSLLLLLATPAFAAGPVLMGGAVVTLHQTVGGVTIDPMVGPAVRAGIELGDRFNNEITVQFTRVEGKGASGGITVPIDLTTIAAHYTFAVDFFKKEGLKGSGFTPSLGIGLAIGGAHVNTAADPNLAKWGPYLEFHAVAGFRYTLSNGLGFRLEATLSTYGGFIAVIPAAGVAYRF